MLLSILEQSLLFLPLAIGVYMSYVVLRMPDLTTDGSFVLGAAIFAISVQGGINPFMAMLFATGAGGVAGMAVSCLQTYFRLNPLIAGILLVFILNTVTLKLMGRPNLSLFDSPSIFSVTVGYVSFSAGGIKIIMLTALAFVLILGVGFLLMSRLGLMLYAFGNNATLLNLCGKNARVYRMVGLSLSNGLVGFCGALTAQASGYADIGMGTGIILIALGTVIIGQQFSRHFYMPKVIQLSFCFVGVFVYFALVNSLISLGLDPIYLRMMIGLCLVGFLAMTKEKTAYDFISS